MATFTSESTAIGHPGADDYNDPKSKERPTLPPPALSNRYKTGAPWSSLDNFKAYMMEDVDPSLATLPLSAFCFMTGFM